jgi:hypothetical protein
MRTCPFCENALATRSELGWQCSCGELIPFGLENDSEENCEQCPVLYCPRRKRPVAVALNATP